MPWSRLSGSLSTPKVEVAIDMGNPFLNLTLDGFLKIGTVISSSLLQFLVLTLQSEWIWRCVIVSLVQVAATRAAAEDTYHIIRKGYSLYRSSFPSVLFINEIVELLDYYCIAFLLLCELYITALNCLHLWSRIIFNKSWCSAHCSLICLGYFHLWD